MPRQHNAFLCALATAFLLFSCNSKKTNTSTASAVGSSGQYDTVNVLPDELVNINAYNTGFIDEATQHFTARLKKISVITAKKGLKLTVDPAVLEKEDGSPVNGKINVSIIELTNTNDLFKSNAATISNGRLLVSGGSYFVGMECNGQKLRIKSGKTMQVDFPRLTNDDMELFYGQRDDADNMNWKQAGTVLKPVQEEIFDFSNDNVFANDFPMITGSFGKEPTLYRSLNEELYYYDKKMTIREIVDTINKYERKVYLDTVYAWPKQLAPLPAGAWVDTNFLTYIYGPRLQFCLKNYKSVQDEKVRLEKQKDMQDSALKKWQPQTLLGQIQKYYSPSAITALGWLNCDRLYKSTEKTDVEVDIPITLNVNHIHYFLIFKSFNGLLDIFADTTGDHKKKFRGLPLGEPVVLIGFTKNNGQILQCTKEFVIQKNKLLQLDFTNISAEEMTKMFGKNVRI